MSRFTPPKTNSASIPIDAEVDFRLINRNAFRLASLRASQPFRAEPSFVGMPSDDFRRSGFRSSWRLDSPGRLKHGAAVARRLREDGPEVLAVAEMGPVQRTAEIERPEKAHL